MSAEQQGPQSPEPRRQDSREERGTPTPREFVLAILAVVILVFALSNLGDVSVHWVVATSRAPLVIVILVALLFGFAIGWLGRRSQIRRRR